MTVNAEKCHRSTKNLGRLSKKIQFLDEFSTARCRTVFGAVSFHKSMKYSSLERMNFSPHRLLLWFFISVCFFVALELED
jgi:hypothetical protein